MKEVELHQRLARLEVVLAMGLAIDKVQARHAGLDEFLATVHEGVSKLMDAKNFYVAVCDDQRLNFRFAYVRDSLNPKDFEDLGWISLDTENSMLTAWVIKNAKPLIIDSKGFSDRDRPEVARSYTGIRPNHWMGIPLLLGDGRAIGAMVVQTYEANNTYSSEDQDLFSLLANDVALFIERVQKLQWLEQSIKERTQSLETEIAERRKAEELQRAVFEISALSSEEGDQSSHYEKLHEIIGRLLPAQNFFICRREPDANEFEIVYFVDQTEPGVSRIGERIPLNAGLTSLVFRTGMSWLLDQELVANLVRFGDIDRIIGSQHFVHWLGVPLILQDQTIGAIVTQSYDADVTFSQQDMELLNFVAQHVAGTFGKLRARDALQKIQQELVLRNEALIDALDNLQSAQGELVRQERLASLGALVAGVAHEINTPLGVCVTATSHLEEELLFTLAEKANGSMNEKVLEQFFEAATDTVRILKSNTQRAAKLIQSFKQISVDQSSGEMRTVNLAGYINEVLATLGPSLKHRMVSFKIDCPPSLVMQTYPGVLAQIITNLVMNSLIHGFENRAHGLIIISIFCENDTVHLQYSDDGNGMDAASLNKLFDPFYTTKRGTGGRGLGAHIVHNLITGPLLGRIQVSSSPGHGLHYDIRLPLRLIKNQPG